MGNEIHAFFKNGALDDYLRSTITLPGVSPDPWLYYPPEKNPADYVSPHTGQNPTHVNGSAVTKTTPSISVISGTPVALPSISATDDDDEDDASTPDADGTYHTDRRGRIWVPRKFIADLGLTSGQVAYAVTENATLKIVAVLDPSATEAVAYKVDRHGNIAVSKGCLVEAGLTGSSFDIDGDSSAVSIKTTSPVAVAAN